MSTPLALKVEAASLKGMALGLAAHTMFSVHDALIKGVIYGMPAPQILFVRSVIIVGLCLAAGRATLLRDFIASNSKGMMFARGLLTLAAWVMYFSSGRHLQLAEMTTLYYFAPVLTTLLAVVFLKEQLTLARIGAVSIGFFGVIVAANPADFTLSLPVLMVLGAAFFWAVAMIMMRTISKKDSALVQVFGQNAIHAVIMGAVALPMWQGMDFREIALCLATGLIGGFAQYALVESAKTVPASVLGTVEYGALVWSFVFGYLFWGEMPVPAVYAGALLIVAAGLTLAWSEHRMRRLELRLATP